MNDSATGSGNRTSRTYSTGCSQSAEVLGQTALSTRIRGAATVLVTRLSRSDMDDLGIETAPDEESAVRKVLERFAGEGHDRPTYYLMPHAGQVVPFSVGC